MIQSFLVLSGDPDLREGGEPSVLSGDPGPGGGGMPSVPSGDPGPRGDGEPSGQVGCAFADSVPLPGAPMSGPASQSVELEPRDHPSSPPSSELPPDTSNTPLRFQPGGSTFTPTPV